MLKIVDNFLSKLFNFSPYLLFCHLFKFQLILSSSSWVLKFLLILIDCLFAILISIKIFRDQVWDKIPLNEDIMLLRNSSHIIRINFFLFKWLLLANLPCMFAKIRIIFYHLNCCVRVHKILVSVNLSFWQKRYDWKN